MTAIRVISNGIKANAFYIAAGTCLLAGSQPVGTAAVIILLVLITTAGAIAADVIDAAMDARAWHRFESDLFEGR